MDSIQQLERLYSITHIHMNLVDASGTLIQGWPRYAQAFRQPCAAGLLIEDFRLQRRDEKGRESLRRTEVLCPPGRVTISPTGVTFPSSQGNILRRMLPEIVTPKTLVNQGKTAGVTWVTFSLWSMEDQGDQRLWIRSEPPDSEKYTGPCLKCYPVALAAETAVRNRAQDRKQFREYHAVLGEEMPQSVDAFQRMKYTEPERWDALKAKKRQAFSVANTTESGIMTIGSGGNMAQRIQFPIEKRDSGKGNPNAILQIGYPLNNRQKRLLDALPEYDSRLVVPKNDVSMKDLAALTAETDCEFALFMKRGQRLIVRGDAIRVNIDQFDAERLSRDGYRWSGHTHPGVDDVVLMPSDGDKLVLSQFKQEFSVICNSKGRYYVFGKE